MTVCREVTISAITEITWNMAKCPPKRFSLAMYRLLTSLMGHSTPEPALDIRARDGVKSQTACKEEVRTWCRGSLVDSTVDEIKDLGIY